MSSSQTSTSDQPSSSGLDPRIALEAFRMYPFETDSQYQLGLSSIIAGGTLEGKTDEETAYILLNSRVFYFNRITGASITLDDATAAGQSVTASSLQPVTPSPQPPSSVSPSTTLVTSTPSGEPIAEPPTPQPASDPEPRVLSFSELKTLIEEGRTDEIPFNKTIPQGLNDASPSQSLTQVKKKPWELVEG
ncbi:hypothetical protein JAAARDRAFT_161104 [Jaapia argillacea MUCL 33604]|uniref:Uncharacterized protein n=1 Tax=Jaapia argillacea MUCL 33604 TaxID=933084 RepID=A0A067PJY9_9AGAM|nr:hypothetical protein JAAARDRAFT_161104 [Jaapia argillacea MUCL 33604]